MGGKEASRGFLYQAIASVLEALTDKNNNWDKIYVEFPTQNDKVDIALRKQNQTFKSIQVKSTINTFSKSNIISWISELVKDIKSPEYELILIGQCDRSANIFMKSIEKFYDNKLDSEAKASLNGFDTGLLDNKRICISNFPYEMKHLERITRDLLHKYISDFKPMITYEQISFILSAIINDQLISSTHGRGIDRKEFDEDLKKRLLLLLSNKHSAERISIGIKSFTPRAAAETERCLSLLDQFDGRNLKDEYAWNDDIYNTLEEFLKSNTKANDIQAYQIYLDTHMSVAFAAGRISNKSGINVFPVQRTATGGTVLWDVKQSFQGNYSQWEIVHEGFNDNQYDSALILNVTRNIYDEVVEFIKENNLPIGHIINCKLDKVGATNFSIEDGNHAALLANSIHDAIKKRSKEERKATLHIFASAPNAFMFFLGQNSPGFGRCVLYEYDFEQRDSCSYSRSIDFTD